MIEIIIMILTILLFVSVFGYLFSIIKERLDLSNNRVVLKSKKISQQIIDENDLKIFKLGRTRLNIGDELKVTLKDSKPVSGTLIGAKKATNSLCLITENDEIVELNIKLIQKLKVTLKYGRII